MARVWRKTERYIFGNVDLNYKNIYTGASHEIILSVLSLDENLKLLVKNVYSSEKRIW